MTRRAGFTLIELLVVIAIIAILAAILFPVFARARAKAQQNNCLSNIKQLSLGVIMYASDYDDRFPPAWSTWGNQGHNWATLIHPYIKNLQIYACPSTNHTPTWNEAGYGYGPENKMIGHSYTMNACLGFVGASIGCTATAWPPITQSSVHRPAEIVMLKEGMNPGLFYAANPDAARASCADNCDQGWIATYNPAHHHPWIATRHSDGSNVSYTDGHAKWLSQGELYAEVAVPAAKSMWTNTP